MLLFNNYELTHLEVPGEYSLMFFLCECQQRCPNCHSPELGENDGEELSRFFEILLTAYLKHNITCVCFLGEGKNGQVEQGEFISMCSLAEDKGLRTCLYSGRDIYPEEWMQCFDYVKTGAYKEVYGSLEKPGTNQKMYRRINGADGLSFRDITEIFQKRS